MMYFSSPIVFSFVLSFSCIFIAFSNQAQAQTEISDETYVPLLEQSGESNLSDISVDNDISSVVRRRGLGINLQLGSGYSGVAKSAIGHIGVGLSYRFARRFSLEIRADLRLDLEEFTTSSALHSVGGSGNIRFSFNTSRKLQPYLLLGVTVVGVFQSLNSTGESGVAGGGQAGFGFEWFFGRIFGLGCEVTGFVSGANKDVLDGGVQASLVLGWYL